MSGLGVGLSVAGFCPPGAAAAADPGPHQDKVVPRLYADAFLVWIYARPELDPAPLGYLRAGQSVRLRTADGRPAGTPYKRGCGQGWYAVEPAGFVCLDRRASLTPTRYARSMAQLAPASGPYPFDYALSMGSPSYRRLPSEQERTRKELRFGEARARPLPAHWRGHEELVTDREPTLGVLPEFLLDGGSVSAEAERRLVRRDVPFGSMLAVSRSFTHQAQTFLQSADGTIVPRARTRLFRRSRFEGVLLGQGVALPLGWSRDGTQVHKLAVGNDACQAATLSDGLPPAESRSGRLEPARSSLAPHCLTPTGPRLAARTAIALSGRQIRVGGTAYVEWKGRANAWIPSASLYVAEQKASAPGHGAEPDGSPRKWLHFVIHQGTLVAYRGLEPVFATLASPGIGGVPAVGADPLSTRTTPVGTYRIQFKHRSDDMSPEQTEHRKFFIADVPFAQYFLQPFAIHVAYWHESFGEPMSGGCINVSPKDGERLFSFTEPRVPEEWYGVGSSREFGMGTTLVIER